MAGIGAVPYIGSKISLVSNSDIRYEGILYTINTQESTIALQSVKTFGTEGRKIPEIPPSSEIYDFIIFRGTDIKDLTVLEGAGGSAQLNDPAIMSTNQRPAGGPGKDGGKGKAPAKGGGKADSFAKGSGGAGRGWEQPSKGSSGGDRGWEQPAKGGSKGWGGGKSDGWGGGGGRSDGWGGKSDGWGSKGYGRSALDDGWGSKGYGKSGGGGYSAGGKGKDNGKGGGKGDKGGKGSFKGGKDDGKGKGKGKGDKGGKASGKGGDKGGNRRGGGKNRSGVTENGVPVGELLPEDNATAKKEFAEDFDLSAAGTKFEKVTEDAEDGKKPLAGYNKTSSFFDNISCEATDRAGTEERVKVDRDVAREHDKETFGDTRRPPRPVGVRRGKGKGKGSK